MLVHRLFGTFTFFQFIRQVANIGIFLLFISHFLELLHGSVPKLNVSLTVKDAHIVYVAQTVKSTVVSDDMVRLFLDKSDGKIY